MKAGSLHQVALSVTNLESAVEFYQSILGLHLIAKFDAGPKLAFFDLGGPRLMLEESAESETNSVIYLCSEDLDQAEKELQSQGVEIVQAQHPIHHDADGLFGEAGETEFMMFIKDPSSNLIALAQRKQPTK